MKAGKNIKFTITDSNGEEHAITSMGCDTEDVDMNLEIFSHDKGDWKDRIENSKEWSMIINPIDFNEAWVIAYHGRMYANYFKN